MSARFTFLLETMSGFYRNNLMNLQCSVLHTLLIQSSSCNLFLSLSNLYNSIYLNKPMFI